MSINFCCYGLIYSISCDKTSFDGHEVGFLVAQRGNRSNRGFIADYFVKPPVCITLKFICHIDISHVVLKTFVGSQRSISFELYTKGDRGIGKVAGISDLGNADYAIFHKYGDSRFYDDCAHVPSRASIPFYCPHRLKNVDELTLKIVKTSNSSVPCLGQLEVWGEPSNSVSKQMVLHVNSKWALLSEPLPVESTSETSSNSELHPDSPHKVLCNENDGFPEEFMDPITCNIMLCPMILPCGKIVDQSTLNKFYAVEEEWGRGRSDPFTGLPFSNQRKPMLNSILKAKIDKYLVTHAELDLVKNMPRIIGKTPVSSVPGVSQLTYSSHTQRSPSTDKINSSECFSGALNANSCLSNPSKKTKRTLDELIAESLNGLPSYVEVKKQLPPPKEECAVCEQTSCLFILLCSHLICRMCLLKLPADCNSACSVCGKSFNRNDPVRYHNPSL